MMLNYKYPPLRESGSNACKYILKELETKDIELDHVTFSPVNIIENEKIDCIVSIHKLTVDKNSNSYLKNIKLIGSIEENTLKLLG